MTTQPPITRDSEAWWVHSPALADTLIRDDRVTARRALEPWTPLTGEAAAMWDAFRASPAGAQAASSVLATDGARHAQLSAPVAQILNDIPDDPGFLIRTVELADDTVAAVDSLDDPDLAALAYLLPAQSVVDRFDLDLNPDQVDSCAERQTALLWRRTISEADQVSGMRAAWVLRRACEAAAADPPALSVAAGLAAAGLDRPDVVGLLYGVSIPWVMGVKYGILNVVIETVGTEAWAVLGEVDVALRRGRLAATRLTAAALRRRPPVKAVFRSAAVDIDVPDGPTIPAGDRIAFDVAALNAAGDDDWTFGVPDRHFCSGSRIARVQVAVQVAALAYAFPYASIDEPHLEMIDSRFHNGPRRLRIAL